MPSSLAIIISTFSGPQQGKAIGQWTAWTGIAFLFGPLLGGFLVDALSWRYIFAINVAPIALTMVLLSKLKIQAPTRKSTKIDYLGALLCTAGLGALVFGLIEQTNRGLADPLILTSLIGGTILLAWFLQHESQAKHPMLPLELFKVRNFSVGNAATTAIYAGLSVATFLIVIFVQEVGGYSAFQAGMSLLPVTLIMFALSSRFGELSGKYGPRLFMAVGPIIASAGFLLLLMVDQQVDYWTQLLPGITVFGLGLSVTVAPLTTAVLADIKQEHAGVGSAINNAIARIAGLVATAAVGLIVSQQLGITGFKRGAIAIAVLLLIGGIIDAIGIQNPPPRTVPLTD